MRKARAGSVIRTSDDALWYCGGNWHLKDTSNSYPCMLGYVPEDSFPTELEKVKTVEIGSKSYVKVFGHFGQPLDIYRTVLMEPRKKMVYYIQSHLVDSSL